MTFNNAIRLSFLNVDKVWKYILYRVFVWAIIIGLMSPCFFMIKQSFNEFATSEAFANFTTTGAFYTGTITDTCILFAEKSLAFLGFMGNNYIGVLVYYALLLLILLPTLMNMGKYVVNAMMYDYMSSHARKSFCTTYISCFGKAFLFGFFRSLINVVFNLSIFAIFFGLINIQNQVFEFVVPYVFVLIASLVLSFKQLLIMGWAPAMIICDMSTCKGFFFGIKTTFRRFGICFAVCFMTYLVSMLALVGFGIFSLIIIVPMFAIVTVMSEIVLFFGNHGMKYYIDHDTIISPKKHEELDKIKQIKFLL